MMFGRSDDGQQTQTKPIDDVTAPTEPTADGTLGVPATEDSTPGPAIAPASDSSTDASANPSVDGFLPSPSEPSTTTTDTDNPDDTSADTSDTGLLNLKQQALHQLSPLLDHLDQSAEEKFRTTMMMIQATDNQDLIKTAYEAAQKIEDEKARAQALLDIVNEINYFTQHPSA